MSTSSSISSASLEPTFGGINLEDIKAPECFEVEERARARMSIPVFHDDQHGTAIIVAAAVLNGLEIAGKKLDAVKVVASGAGAAALACLNLLVSLGVKRENIFVSDIEGVVYQGREKLMDRWKAVYAQETKARTLADIIAGADIFLGLSAGGVLKPEMVSSMAEKPLILALANPYPEILPDEALRRQARRHDLHRPLGLSEPGQQRAVLSLHLPRRARCGRDHDQRGDEARRRARHRRARAHGAFRRGGARHRRGGAYLRAAVPDPEPLRSAPDPVDRARGREGRDGDEGRAPSDRGHGSLQGPLVALRLPLGLHHEAALPARQGEPAAGDLRRWRG